MVEGINSPLLATAAEQLKAAQEAGVAADRTEQGGEGSFQDMLTKLISEVDEAQKEADVSLKNLATGKSDSVQDVVMKMEEADLSFRLMKQIRDKLIDAYKEVMTMQS